MEDMIRAGNLVRNSRDHVLKIGEYQRLIGIHVIPVRTERDDRASLRIQEDSSRQD